MPNLKRPDADLSYHWYPAPGRPVVLFSHALGADASMWQPQLEALQGRYQVLVYDVRGHGRSTLANEAVDVATLGRDVLALLDAVQAPRVHFCGLSMGGFTGLWLAAQSDQAVRARFASFVLSNTGARIGSVPVWQERMAAVRAGGLAAITDAVMQRWFTPAFHAQAPQTVARIRGVLLGNQVAGYLACSAMLRDTDLSDLPARVQAPTLVITATQDASTPPQLGHALAATIPGAKLVEFEAAHLANVECAAAFNQALLNFWES